MSLFGKESAQNVENGWQFSKSYPDFIGTDGEPTPRWWVWARAGWRNPRAVRYPMGRGARPVYSYWDGEHLDYIQARRRIYIPLYASTVVRTKAFAVLQRMYAAGDPIVLFDFDGYDFEALGLTLDQVISDPNRKMGHAFVVAMLLTGHPAVHRWL